MDVRHLPALLLALAVAANLGAALGAHAIDPPHNDLVQHGQMVERAATTLSEHGWSAFQDPWFPENNGGDALFRRSPHLAHQWTAVVAVVTGADPWTALAASNLVLVALLPLLAWLGARWLGLEPLAAAIAALVVATARCVDGFGHTPLGYAFGGLGLYGQLWGMAFASLAMPAWVAACLPGGGGLGRMPTWGRVLLAGALGSLVVRSSLPAAWLLALMSGCVVLVAGPLRELPSRLTRFGVTGVVIAVLSAGLLIPLAADLAATTASTVGLLPEHRDSVGLLRVVGRLLGGFYLDGWVPLPWSALLLGALGWTGYTWKDSRPEVRGLAVATVAAILLLAGRATWGDWVGSLPLIGGFDDHRYLLGLHMLAPALIGAGAASAAKRAEPKLLLGVVAGVVLLAGGRQLVSDASGHGDRVAAQADFASARASHDELLIRHRGFGRVAVVPADEAAGGVERLTWLRRNGVETFGRPLSPDSPMSGFAPYWSRATSEMEGPVPPRSQLAAGVRVLIGDDGPSPRFDVEVVRSDLLVEAAGGDLDGFAARWYSGGLHLGLQYPTIDPGAGPRPDRGSYRRHATTDDATALSGLPEADGMGEVLEASGGERDGDRVVRARIDRDHAWLMMATTWHPRWRATVDGQRADHFMLTPGWIGVPLAPGEHTVELVWRPSPWRGPWAAGNIAACLLCLLAAYMSRREFEVSS